MEMQINVNTKIIYMDSAVPVMRAIENVKRDIRKVCCDSDEKGCDIVLIMENMQAEQFEIKCDNNMLVIYASDTLGFVYAGIYLVCFHSGSGMTRYLLRKRAVVFPVNMHTPQSHMPLSTGAGL